MKQLIFLELNEVSLECVNHYIALGKLSNWKFLIDNYGVTPTKSESSDSLLEPWIQWPTIRTGKEFSEHKIFYLGDQALSEIRQHWEILEERGISVAAISPINGINNTTNSKLWIPDPWIRTAVSGSYFVNLIHKAIKQGVNNNSQNKIDLIYIFILVFAILININSISAIQYIKLVFNYFFRGRRWVKAVILDRLLADIFLKFCKIHQPKFITVFLNGAAHIQHHYFYNSTFHSGEIKNPEWYLSKKLDPILDVLEMYDVILGQVILQFKDSRIIICTGLSQLPCKEIIYYWRLKNHKNFFNEIGFEFSSIETRMSRDFTVICNSEDQAIKFSNKISKITDVNGVLIFGKAERNKNRIYITMTYEGLISDNFVLYIDGSVFKNFSEKVSFVAIKNGYHNGNGYIIDSGERSTGPIQISSIFNRVLKHFLIKI